MAIPYRSNPYFPDTNSFICPGSIVNIDPYASQQEQRRMHENQMRALMNHAFRDAKFVEEINPLLLLLED